jgi:transposase
MEEQARKRKFSPEFKEEAVALVTEQGYSIAEAARNLGVGPNLLSRWKKQIEEQNNGSRLQSDERAELARLRAENRRLKMEREILKKAAAFFANETK